MSTPVRASDRDLRALAAIVSEDRPDLPDGEGLPPSLLADLMGQIRCDVVSFEGLDSGRHALWFWQKTLFQTTTPQMRSGARAGTGGTGPTTGTANPPATRTAAATCAAS